MNVWDNITIAQITYNLIYQENLNKGINDYDLLYIIYNRNSKLRTRNYKNFLIYFTNHYYLTDVTNETNLTFEKFFRKLEILL